MAAGEDQAQAVVGDGGLVVGGPLVVVLQAARRGVARGQLGQPADAVGQAALAAQAVDGLAPRRRGDPRARAVGHPVARPGGDGGGEGVLQRVLGQREVADLTDQRREDRRALLTEGPRDRRIGHAAESSMIGRTSTLPYGALGTLAAQARAASRSGTSIMK